MDTEIKSTLFRFVNMKAPELNSDHETKPSFITQSLEHKGVFNEAVENLPEGTTKMSALQNEALDFSASALDTDGLKNLNTELYDFSVWLAKNKNRAKETEISSRVANITDKSLNLIIIWNNLFYQIITQKDFYAKETVMQLLVAYHVCNYEKGTFKQKALAKVVLPKELFIEDNKSGGLEVNLLSKGINLTPEVDFSSPILNNLEKQATAQENIRLLTKLKMELQASERVYRKSYEAQFNKDYKTYKAEIKPIVDKYNEDVEAAKKDWCAVRPVSSTLPYDSSDPCQQPPLVPEPVIPEFEFSYIDELDDTFISKQLSAESYEVYQNLNKNQTNSNNTEFNNLSRTAYVSPITFESFDSVYSGINQLIDAENETIIDNSIDNGNTAVVIGGTTVSIPNTTIPLEPFQYEIKTRLRTFYIDSATRYLQIMVGIPDPTWKINAVQYKMTKFDDTFILNSSTSVNHFTGYDALLNLSMNGITSDLKELAVTFQLANGKVATVLITNFSLNSVYKNFITLPDEILNPDSSDGNNTPGDNTTVAPENTFIPSGFGVKQIGIADYNKVEQSIHGYVEGEVAHIENVMAREFKEKSTRRLRRSEITETTSSETEKEHLTDTTSVDRFEMQSEVAKVIANSKDFSGNVGMSYSPMPEMMISANASYATHNSNEQSTRQAVTNAKEITERALDRIVTKVKEERIEKIIEEFEENNVHGFDNRKGDQHVVGVYRWVDKVMKNQIINYGKRLMFEFMIPEPAKLHKLAMETLVTQKKATTLTKPEDPRTATSNKLENYSQLDDTKLKFWSGKYNVEFNSKPEEYIQIGKSFSFTTPEHNGGEWDEVAANNSEIEIPDGYKAISGKALLVQTRENGHGGYVLIGNQAKKYSANTSDYSSLNVTLSDYTNKVPVSYSSTGHHSGSANFEVKCQLTLEAKAKWQKETFNAIIEAYEDALQKYNEALATEQTNGVQILGTNPGFYREIENTILRKNCISYLISNNPNAKRTFGNDFYIKNNSDSMLNFSNAIIKQNADLDDYASFVKFMEQAFEWDIMSYYFYPFYWGKRSNWVEMYQYDQTHDHIFKAFMQSGMARTIVTVRPGFEEAVRYYMQTGQIWNGGEVPVIGDELFLSIVEELQKPEGEKVGKAWPTRIPTSMTILQAQSIGLNVTKALPSNDDDLDSFENPDEVPQSSQIDFNNAQIGGDSNSGTANLYGEINGNEGIEAKILLKKIDGSIQDMTYCDVNGKWELKNLPAGKFELLLDAQNDFPETEYIVMEGSKEQMVVLEINTAKEVNLKVKKIE